MTELTSLRNGHHIRIHGALKPSEALIGSKKFNNAARLSLLSLGKKALGAMSLLMTELRFDKQQIAAHLLID